MRLANMDEKYRQDFLEEAERWADEQYANITRHEDKSIDPSPIWDEAHGAIHDIAYQHFGAPKTGPKKPWLSAETRGIL